MLYIQIENEPKKLNKIKLIIYSLDLQSGVDPMALILGKSQKSLT